MKIVVPGEISSQTCREELFHVWSPPLDSSFPRSYNTKPPPSALGVLLFVGGRNSDQLSHG